MAKKKKKEKLPSDKKSSQIESNFSGPSRMVVDLVFFASVVIITGSLAFSLQINKYDPPTLNTSSKTTNSFAHLNLVGSIVNKNLLVAYEDQKKDFTSKLAGWNDIGYYTYSQKSLVPGRYQKSLTSVVLSTFGIPNPWQAFGNTDRVLGYRLDENQIYFDLSAELAESINRVSKDAELVIENGRATTFQPYTVGRSLDTIKAGQKVARSLFEKKSEMSLPVITTFPHRLLSETNDLGINELVTQGESNFVGSSASRITNIRVGSEKFNGIILKPGEEFSFNNNLGPVTAEEGFKPELVIKSSGTVPELGGGLCQVSTTAFRAALYGGLDITARKNHSYAVSYYSPQGTDATIYPGVVDFKFINDTSAHLLIWTRMEGTKLYFEFYGTKDQRKVAIDGPYQYDFGAGGAMKARLSRTVELDGKESEDVFYSNYVSKNLFPTIYEYPDQPQTPNTNQPPPPPNEEQQNPAPDDTPLTDNNETL